MKTPILACRGALKVFILLSFVSCVFQEEKGPLRYGINPVTRELMQTVSFQQVQTEVFQNKCIACHGNSGGVNLESYSATVKHLKAIERTVFKFRSMPKSPYPALNQREMDVLKAWIEVGAPERPSGSGPSPEPIEATYESINKHVLVSKCISCHGPGGQVERIPLVTKNDLLNSPLDLVVPGEPDDSGLTIVLEPGARKFMPPIDSGITPVSEEERNAIRTWIQNGAP